MVLLPFPAGSPVNRHRDKLSVAQGISEARKNCVADHQALQLEPK